MRPVTQCVRKFPVRTLPAALVVLAAPSTAHAQVDSGDTAWILASTALVLFMTLPGLALFYGGLVRTKNVLSVLMQCFALAAMITIIWLLFGYSVAFDTTGMEGRHHEPRVLRRRSVDGVPRRRRTGIGGGLDPDGPPLRIPDDVRDHHARADRPAPSRSA